MKATLSGRDERILMKVVVARASDRVVGVHVHGPRRRRDHPGGRHRRHDGRHQGGFRPHHRGPPDRRRGAGHHGARPRRSSARSASARRDILPPSAGEGSRRASSRKAAGPRCGKSWPAPINRTVRSRHRLDRGRTRPVLALRRGGPRCCCTTTREVELQARPQSGIVLRAGTGRVGREEDADRPRGYDDVTDPQRRDRTGPRPRRGRPLRGGPVDRAAGGLRRLPLQRRCPRIWRDVSPTSSRGSTRPPPPRPPAIPPCVRRVP